MDFWDDVFRYSKATVPGVEKSIPGLKAVGPGERSLAARA
jgi:hypothetical protein